MSIKPYFSKYLKSSPVKMPVSKGMKYLIVGLGNIGPEYADTRHNIGFMIADVLAKKNDAMFANLRLSYYTEMSYKGKKIYLIKPTTYMNLSGKAVNYWM